MKPILYIASIIFLPVCIALAQFSPGELSRAHQGLEGTDNCTQCHEIGQEINGGKCLTCHTEIRQQLDRKHGFHFTNRSEKCVNCHKEHVGRESHTYIFDETDFQHGTTGFSLTGKHLPLKCEQCHTKKNIANDIVLKKLAEFPHKTFLGLSQSCRSCHEDVHKGRFKNECSSCHTTDAWKPAPHFDHATAAFKLEGEHTTVACSQCHASLKTTKKTLVDFMTKNFSDCTPCHATPHGSKFSGRDCKSCHSAKSWRAAMKKGFDHSLTAFQLVGKHTTVACEQCHRPPKKKSSSKPLRLAHERCTDCHTDKHNGEFASRYSNDCLTCHNEYGFRPSLFTIARHSESRFKLSGAHTAVLCSSCHQPTSGTKTSFHFEHLNCESCHKNPHGKAFTFNGNAMQCESCHSTADWITVSFDHSTTKFTLTGKHSELSCKQCHGDRHGKSQQEFSKPNSQCSSCHADIHQQQFAVANNTDCALCHTSSGWKSLLFNHETQSRFSLKGGHRNVRCIACHREEEQNGKKFIRFKPMQTQCESCHQ